MDERKRLKLLPEVLPAPNRVAKDSGPRSRTREHMQRLLAAAALTGAVAACKTDPGYGVVDPMPTPADANGPPMPPIPPPPDATPATSNAALPSLPSQGAQAAGDAGKSAAAGKPIAPQPVPYGVVDPLPMPARDAGPPKKDGGRGGGSHL